MEASGVISKEQQPQFDALRENLSMMSKRMSQPLPIHWFLIFYHASVVLDDVANL